MINEVNVLKLVKRFVNSNNELCCDTFLDITGSMDDVEVTEVMVVLEENGISVVDDATVTIDDYSLSSDLVSLTNEELCVLYQGGDKSALEALTYKNQRLIHSVASKMLRYYKPDILEEGDLFVEGWFGLQKAAEKFDVGKGFKFTTYAMWWIRQVITRELMNNGNRIRIPVHVYEDIIRLNKCRNELFNGTVKEICDMLTSKYSYEYTEERVESLMKIADTYLCSTSLNSAVGDDGRTEVIDFVRSDYSVEDEVVGWRAPEIVEDCLTVLSDRESQVLRLRFGLTTGIPMTLEEVGNEFGVTRERIRQIEDKALRKLSRHTHTRKLEGLYAA